MARGNSTNQASIKSIADVVNSLVVYYVGTGKELNDTARASPKISRSAYGIAFSAALYGSILLQISNVLIYGWGGSDGETALKIATETPILFDAAMRVRRDSYAPGFIGTIRECYQSIKRR